MILFIDLSLVPVLYRTLYCSYSLYGSASIPIRILPVPVFIRVGTQGSALVAVGALPLRAPAALFRRGGWNEAQAAPRDGHSLTRRSLLPAATPQPLVSQAWAALWARWRGAWLVSWAAQAWLCGRLGMAGAPEPSCLRAGAQLAGRHLLHLAFFCCAGSLICTPRTSRLYRALLALLARLESRSRA